MTLARHAPGPAAGRSCLAFGPGSRKDTGVRLQAVQRSLVFRHLCGIGAIAAVAFAVIASGATTSSRASGDPVIASAGDIACDPVFDTNYNDGAGTSKACRQLFTSNLLVAGNFSAVLPLGDDQYECAGLAAFQQVYGPSWGRVKSITYPVTGNHEYQASGGTDCDAAGIGSRVLQLLRRGRRGCGARLLLVRHRHVAPDRPQLELPAGRGLLGRVARGAVAARRSGRPHQLLHARLLALPAVLLER